MFPAFDRLFRSLFSSSAPKRIVILGLDYAGKSTLIRRLKLGDIVATIPTIGFYVETVTLPTTSGKLEAVCWNVGGCDKIRPLWQHYFQGLHGAIFMIDSYDRDRLEDSISECIWLQNEIIKNPECDIVPLLILANKQDLPDAVSVDELKEKLLSRLPLPDRTAIFGISATSPNITAACRPPFDWLREQVSMPPPDAPGKQPPIGDSKASKVPSFDPRSPQALSEKLESWSKRLETDTSPEEFLDQFNRLDLPSWDHYTHIRLAFIILTTFGRQKGKNMIFDGIQNYIANSGKTTGRAFHITMTYFWIQIVHFGIRQTPPSVTSQSVSTSEVTANDFGLFLIINPYVVDGNLWEDYYSREVIMTPKAKEEMVLPDKKPLPNIVPADLARN